MFYFLDTSAIVKHYVFEIGSNFVDGLVDAQNGNTICLARLTQVELASAIARRLRDGSLTAIDARNALRAFQEDFANLFTKVEVTANIVSLAVDLATKHTLRAYDAVQLSAALATNLNRVRQSLSPLVFVSADNNLNIAAQAELRHVENPNRYP